MATTVVPVGRDAAEPATRRTRTPRPGPGRAAAPGVSRRSWNPNHQRGCKQQLERQGTQTEEDEGPGRLVVAGIACYLDRCLFQCIDLPKNAAQRLTVLGAEVTSAGFLRDFLEQRLIDAHRQELVPEAAQTSASWNGRLPDGTNADSVDLDTE